MNTDHSKSTLRHLTRLSLMITVAISVLSLIGWALKSTMLTSLSQSFIPIALSSALCLFILSASFLIYTIFTSNLVRTITVFCASFTFLIASILLIAFFMGIPVEAEYLGLAKHYSQIPYRRGHMSPVTALMLIFASSSIILLTLPDLKKQVYKNIASLIGLTVSATGSVIILGYVHGTPLLYKGTLVPVALPTAVIFVFFGLGIILASGSSVPVIRIFTGSSMRSRLTRAFLPVTVAFVLISDMVKTITQQLTINIALVTSFLAILSTAIIGIIIAKIAILTGAEIDNVNRERDKKAEELRVSEQRLRDIIFTIADWVWEVDAYGFFTYSSQKGIDLFGESRGDIIGKRPFDFMPPDEAKRVAAMFSEIMANKAPIKDLENWNIRKNGERICLLTNGLPILDEEGNLKGYRGVDKDITERKDAEEKLRQQTDAMDAAIDGIAILNKDGKYAYLNKAHAKIYGYENEAELIGKSWRILYDSEVIQRFEQDFMPELSRKGYWYGETIGTKKNGSKYSQELSLTAMANGGLICVVRDISERKRAEEAIKDAQTRYRLLFEHSPDGIVIIDPDTARFLEFNETAHRQLGYSREEFARLSISDLDVFETIEETRLRITKVIQEGRNDFETLQRTRQGEIRNVQVTAQTTEILGKPVYHCVWRDITDRKLAEKALRERDIQLKKLASWAPGMMYQFTKRPDGTYCVPFTTEAVKDIFGCSPEDVREDFSPIARVILPEDFDKVFSSIEYSAKHLIIWTCEYRVQIPGQSIRWILGKSTPEMLADGSITWYGFNTDITEIKKVEEALQKSEEEFRSLAESMPQIVWVTRKDGWNIYFNQQWVDYTGLTLEESYGHGWNIPFHPDDQQSAWDAWQNATKNNGIYSVESRLRRADGVYHWWLIRGVPLLDETGEIIKWFGTCTDIDNIKVAEKQLEDTIESLSKAVGATIQVMVSAVEMRDPYTAGHQLRVSNIACAIATEMGLPQEKIEAIRMAGSIHDIGKLSIPAEILSKPTKLTDLEFSLIKEHPQTGYEMLKNVESPWPLAQIVYQHHERMDGSGYPRKLKGDEILLEARIMAVADVVEAMASHRPYRAALGIEIALQEIEKNKGTHYDNTVADACLKLFREKGFKLEGA